MRYSDTVPSLLSSEDSLADGLDIALISVQKRIPLS
jgi:hypothetical protein